MHETGSTNNGSTLVENDTFQDAHQDYSADDGDNTLLIQAATQRSNLAPSDIRRVLSNKANKSKPQKPNLHVETSVHEMTYRVSNHCGYVDDHSSLIDRGANGGLAGSNMRIIATTDRHVDIICGSY